MTKRILLTGSRLWTNRAQLRAVLVEWGRQFPGAGIPTVRIEQETSP